jgi:hypothetical protein
MLVDFRFKLIFWKGFSNVKLEIVVKAKLSKQRELQKKFAQTPKLTPFSLRFLKIYDTTYDWFYNHIGHYMTKGL